MPGKILVTGATGKQGGAVARVLLERGHDLRAMTRDPSKPEADELRALGIEVVRGDYDDPASVREAMREADTVFLMATPYERGGPEAEERQAIAAVDAAEAAGVSHLVYSSVASADENTSIPHFESKWRVEQHIRQLGLRASIVAPVFFMENLLSPGMLPGLAQGKLALPLSPDRGLQMIGVREIARFVAEAIEDPDAFVGKRVDIASDEVTPARVAEILTRATGRTVTFQEIPKAVAREQQGDDLARMYEWFERVGYSADIARLRREHPDVGWRTFDEWARAQDWGFLTPGRSVHAS